MNYSDIKVNFKELSVLSDFSVNKCRQIFKDHLNSKEIKIDVEILLSDLEKHFTPVHTMDERYDKMPQLEFNVMMKTNNYRFHLKDKAMIKVCTFTEGRTIYNKILSPDQLDHAKKAFKHNHLHMYGQASYEKLNIT